MHNSSIRDKFTCSFEIREKEREREIRRGDREIEGVGDKRKIKGREIGRERGRKRGRKEEKIGRERKSDEF